MTTVTANPQMGLEEQVLDNPMLLLFIEDYLRFQYQAREYARAKRRIKKFQPQAEGRYRVGPYLLTIESMAGGGFQVKRWTTLVSTITTAEG